MRVALVRHCILSLHVRAAALLRPQPWPLPQVLGHFTLYDYNSPLDVPDVLHGAFDVVVADPPYLVCPAHSCTVLVSKSDLARRGDNKCSSEVK